MIRHKTHPLWIACTYVLATFVLATTYWLFRSETYLLIFGEWALLPLVFYPLRTLVVESVAVFHIGGRLQLQCATRHRHPSAKRVAVSPGAGVGGRDEW